MATTNLGLKTFGHDEPIDFNDWNDNLVKIDTAVGEAKRGKAEHNLLDNGDFQINQRGASSYTGAGYTVDRWYMYDNGSALTATPSSNGLTLANGGSSAYNIIQRLPFDLSGKTVTFAVCDSTGSVTILSGVIPTGDVSSNTSMLGSANSADGAYYITIYKRSSTQAHEVRINVFAGRSTTIRWAALYEGAYTADTLPAYVPKGYAAELAECQRYYREVYRVFGQSVGNVAREAIILNPPMRIHPTAAVKSLYKGTDDTSVTVNQTDYNNADVSYTGFGSLILSLSADL